MSEPGTPDPLRITAEELARAVVPAAAPAPPRRMSQLAVAALVLGLLGLPLVGFVLGPVAIGCGVAALWAIQRRDALGGMRLAVAGIALGAVDLVVWTVGLLVLLSRPTAPRLVEPILVESVAPSAIVDAPPHIRRALRANVVVRCRGPRGEQAVGSGVILGLGRDDYYLLTNRHVTSCGGAGAALSVAVVGGGEEKATVVWTAPDAIDAVVLGVTSRARPEPAALHGGPAPRVGDPVFAVGNPLGYEGTYTAGVLSAMRSSTYGRHSLRVLQVQASVNPGNSGGGLYDAAGGLIGLTTWTAAKGVAEGLGFAVASDDLLQLIDEDAPAELVTALRAQRGAIP